MFSATLATTALSLAAAGSLPVAGASCASESGESYWDGLAQAHAVALVEIDGTATPAPTAPLPRAAGTVLVSLHGPLRTGGELSVAGIRPGATESDVRLLLLQRVVPGDSLDAGWIARDCRVAESPAVLRALLRTTASGLADSRTVGTGDLRLKWAIAAIDVPPLRDDALGELVESRFVPSGDGETLRLERRPDPRLSPGVLARVARSVALAPPSDAAAIAAATVILRDYPSVKISEVLVAAHDRLIRDGLVETAHFAEFFLPELLARFGAPQLAAGLREEMHPPPHTDCHGPLDAWRDVLADLGFASLVSLDAERNEPRRGGRGSFSLTGTRLRD